MQISDVPDLAHTQPRPVHWLATATAMAAVVALAGLLQPDAATAGQPGSEPTGRTAPNAAPLPAPDTAAVDFPLECGGAKALVTKEAVGDLDGDANPETVAAARCDAGSGTPPTGVYVLTGTKDAGAPRIVATLVDPADRQSVADLEIRDGVVRARLLGYSGPDVPGCCPDEERSPSWEWENGAFVRSEDGRSESRSV
ncbi:hypothetical protein GCM10011583_56740 [Streptomyces camponoticapitis]|uniref:Secreted protein n=1 Tax=Streptomyces camponoticapitis TaxID=1616125 RepID=A0ABQ2EN21_9ACTN|nr:hypothetical protein [Streptomyces camponoticapitis]GGK17537.1 hypothetical protein GCM10011583_56740 [Streptomyces camponoticapitis]